MVIWAMPSARVLIASLTEPQERLRLTVTPAIARNTHRTQQNYSTFPQSLMVTLTDVFPLPEPTASIFLTTS
jgi:hypothetical protein